MSEQEFTSGHVFFRTGDAAGCAYQLLEGEVELLADVDGSLTCVRQFSRGAIFGELALIDARPRTSTARAVSSVLVTVLTRGEFEDSLAHHPAPTLPYLRALFERLRSLAAASVDPAEFEAASAADSEPTPSAYASVELPIPDASPSNWVIVLQPLTHKAAETLPEDGLRVAQFPLRIGRASDGREPEAQQLNDLWLIDQKPYHVSRNHCEIVVDEDGPIVRDRGSHLGCIVNDEPIGGRIVVSAARLIPGENVLVIGSRMSKYQFRVIVSPRSEG